MEVICVNKTALLIIDMQNDFARKGSIVEVKGLDMIVPKLSRFIKALRQRNVLVIYTRHIFDQKLNPQESRMFPLMNKEVLKDNSKGSQIITELIRHKNDIVLKKMRYDAFLGTPLELILKSNNIQNVIITGTMTNICCESTARTAMMKNFNVYFCSDLTCTTDKMLHENTLRNIASHFGNVVRSEEIMKLVS